jgi:triosephosphate isomerase
MKKVFIIANWKSNKTIKQTEEWFTLVKNEISNRNITLGDKQIVVAPSFTSLERAESCIKELTSSFKLAAQDISSFDEGPYTGEINGKQLKEFESMRFVLVGHSERRQNFGETNEICAKKVCFAFKSNLEPIYFIQNSEDLIPQSVGIVVYEPISAIGTGLPDTPENANQIAGFIKSRNNNLKVIYGGSVTSENVKSFTSKEGLDGIIVGKASLDPLEFVKIIENA